MNLPQVVKDKDLNDLLWVILTRKYQSCLSNDVLPGDLKQERKPFNYLHLDDFEESSRREMQEAFTTLIESPENYVKSKKDVNGFDMIYAFDYDKLKKLALDNLNPTDLTANFLNRLRNWQKMHGLGWAITDCFYTFNGPDKDKKYDGMLQKLSDNGVIITESSVRVGKHFLDLGNKSPSQYVRILLDIETQPSTLYLTYPKSFLLI